MSDKIKKYISIIEEKTGSKTFCVLPWIHLATRPNGDSRLCCVANASGASIGDHAVGLVKKENGKSANFENDTPLSIWNNKFMKDVRKTMLAGNVPQSCTKCFEEEANGVVSKRLWEMYDWNNDGLDFKKLIRETKEDGSVPPIIRYLDLRLGHTCNLKCVMCSPHDSSRWVQDYDKLINAVTSPTIVKQIKWNSKEFNNSWYEKSNFWNDIFEQIPYITKLYFAGGEPLMIKEHQKFLEEIISRGYSNQISLRYNSNGVLLTDKMLDLWSKFKHVKFNVSIDAVADRNFYIRYPTQWNEVLSVLEKLDNTSDNISTSIEVAVQALNIEHLPDFAKFIINQKYRKINKHYLAEYQAGGGIFSMHLLFIPTFLSARILTQEHKNKIRSIFSEFKQWLWDNYTQEDDFWKHNPYGWKRWEAILRFVEAEDHTHLIPDFKEYIKNLDAIRGLDFYKTFPEFKNFDIGMSAAHVQ